MIKIIIEKDLFIEKKEIEINEIKVDIEDNLYILKKGEYELRDKKANDLCLKLEKDVNIIYGGNKGMFNIKLEMKYF